LIALACGRPRPAAQNGPCVFWRRRSSSCRSSRAPATTRSGGRSKKHSPAPSQACLDVYGPRPIAIDF
jgi:hypothetical protein